ncbi:hypothetical protein OHD60_26415, partial [Escherichia coli]|nr:hypothetical protein [Escherichia coli]
MSNIVHLSDKKTKKTNQLIFLLMITQTISAKGSSKISAINKKKELISKIKAILKSRNVAFRSTPPSDWKEKSRTFAIFFPEKKGCFYI